MAVVFETYAKIYSQRDEYEKDELLEMKNRREYKESSLIFNLEVSVPKLTSDMKNEILISAITYRMSKSSIDVEKCQHIEEHDKIIFHISRSQCDYYDYLDEMYAIKYHIEDLLRDVLDEFRIPKCKIMLMLAAVNMAG